MTTPQLTYNEDILHKEQFTGVIDLTPELVDRYVELTGIPVAQPADGERQEAPTAMLNVFFTRNQEQGADVKLRAQRSVSTPVAPLNSTPPSTSVTVSPVTPSSRMSTPRPAAPAQWLSRSGRSSSATTPVSLSPAPATPWSSAPGRPAKGQ